MTLRNSISKLTALLFAIAVGISLAYAPAPAFADVAYDEDVASVIDGGSYVVDESNLLSTTEEVDLASQAYGVYSSHSVAAYYVTVDSLDEYSQAVDYTDSFIDTYDLGTRAPGGCVVFLVCLPESQFAIVSAGGAQQTLDNDVLDYLSTELNPYLGRSDWVGAGETFFDDVAQTLSGQQANASSEVAYNGTYVTDDYGLFNNSQRAELEAAATALAQQYDMGVYLLVVDYMQDSSGYDLANPSSAQRTNFATSFYRANDLGLGSGNDGIMLVIAVDSRDYVTIAYGQGSYSFSDAGIEAVEEAVTDRLGSNDWYGGCEAYYDTIGEQLEYYEVRGEPWTEPDLLSFVLKILAALGIPAGAAFGRVNREKAAMKTAREKTEASTFLVPGSFKLTRSDDRFITTTRTVVPIPRNEDRGSSGGGGGFGGGGWGGGGGGGFSSSGGGKF